MLGEAGTILADQPLGIDEPVAVTRILLREALRHHCRNHKIGNAGCRFSRSQEQEFLVCELSTGDPQGRKEAGECYGGTVSVRWGDGAVVITENPAIPS